MQYKFPGGHPALDFVGTLWVRHGDAPIEKLTSPEHLDIWFREAGVADGETNCRQSDLQEARELREAIYSIVTARMAHESYDEDALTRVNRAARTPSAAPQLTAAGSWIEATPEQAMSFIAREAITLCGGPEAELLKGCSNPGCSQIYLDRSRGARREWCAMDPCGNKMKAAAYRARKKSRQLSH